MLAQSNFPSLYRFLTLVFFWSLVGQSIIPLLETQAAEEKEYITLPALTDVQPATLQIAGTIPTESTLKLSNTLVNVPESYSLAVLGINVDFQIDEMF
jgi:hypothetical protein